MPQILLVDDDKVQALTRQVILQKTGFDVIVAGGPAAALRILNSPELSPSLHLIVTDHLMPEMNGPEMVREIRRVWMSIPVLVLSGLPSAASEYDDLDVSFRIKPFPPDQLIALVGELVGADMKRTA
jgi:DNA-binding response OmpR family regulator